MSEIKLSVSIVLPGSILLTQAEAEQLEKEKKGTGFDFCKVKVQDRKGRTDFLNVRTRKCRTVSQCINMSFEAYSFMTSNEGYIPGTVGMKAWKRLGKAKRLEMHLDVLCRSLGGMSYTYKVFDD